MNSQYMRHEVRGCETSDLRNFWEKTIEQQTQYLQSEKERQRRSALTKLRNEWMERLEKRIKMLRTQSEGSSS
ncbi:protein FAM240B-like [Melospiza georgiana]|uniref:protein FAM240B-like n=1 Tax=Melospiza georgiana TaxID=44398 RepID=UPI0025AC89A6|nr:protein FAM240B-like [Melospiza georgiana]